MQTSPAPVLQIGDPRLREVARPVSDPTSRDFLDAAARLTATLDAFRRAQGFGRAIAAPQIGVSLRLLAMNLADGPFLTM
jgi:peptide deformylase